MKLPHLIALAAGIAVIHLVVILLVMNGGCGNSEPPAKGPAAPSAASASLPSAAEKTASPEKTVSVQGTEKKGPVPENAGTVRPAGQQQKENIPSLPDDDLFAETPVITAKTNGKMEDFGKLPPPSASGKVLRRLPYNWKYAVNEKIPSLPSVDAASAGILLDVKTRNILWMKNPKKPVPIASMSKIMTMILACEDIESGRVQPGARIPVTKSAMALRDGLVWMKPGESFTLYSLLEAAAVKSANDAALLIAEYLGNGSSEDFIRRMNSFAARLGMTSTRFYNPHGLPGRKRTLDNVSSPEDLLKLSEYAMTSPLFRKLVSTQKAEFRAPGTPGYLVMHNHNHLLPGFRYATKGVNGIKTGFTNRAGFCVTVSCVRDNRQLIAVGTGFASAAERERCMRALLEWGFLRAENPSQPVDRLLMQSRIRKPQTVKSAVKTSKRQTPAKKKPVLQKNRKQKTQKTQKTGKKT